MYAVVETCGRQYQIQEGRYIDLDLMDAEPETTITLDKIVAIIAEEKTQIGTPYIEGAKVSGKVLRHFKGKKDIVFKMRRKKGYRVKAGHRQQYTRLLVETIDFPNKAETLEYAQKLEAEANAKAQAQEAKLAEVKEKRQAQKAEKKAANKEVTSAKVTETEEVTKEDASSEDKE